MRRGFLAGITLVFLLSAAAALAAYHHMGDTDSDVFLSVYPDKAGSKLDSCALCHTGGKYEKKPGVWASMGSCQWCHYTYGYDQSGDIAQTLNPYGRDYLAKGRSASAITAVAEPDSDGDGYTNKNEIEAGTYPGNAEDDPAKKNRSFQSLYPAATGIPAPADTVYADEYQQIRGFLCTIFRRDSGKSAV